jgi:hypothetical protein
MPLVILKVWYSIPQSGVGLSWLFSLFLKPMKLLKRCLLGHAQATRSYTLTTVSGVPLMSLTVCLRGGNA